MVNKESVWVIGSYINILESTQPTYIGIHGEVVFETKNMIWLRHTQTSPHRILKLAKDTLLKVVDNKKKVFSGINLSGRPEDR